RLGNHPTQSSDHHRMDCTPIREALSAALDGEDPGAPQAEVDRHLTGCADCRAWLAGVEALHRAVRVRSAEPVPDLTAAIVDAAAMAAQSGASRPSTVPVWRQPVSAWRWALFVVGMTQLIMAGPALLLGDGAGDVHAARELGALNVALAVGLLVAAWE